MKTATLLNNEEVYRNVEVWCDCDQISNDQADECFMSCEFVENGECKCGVWKHHYHGGVCGKIVQIG